MSPYEQHLATRRDAGLFDFSFMGLYELSGTGALAALEVLQTRALSALQPGRLAYTLLLEDQGSVFNDATVWRLAPERWWLFTGRPSDFAWIAARVGGPDIGSRRRGVQQSVGAQVDSPIGGAASRECPEVELNDRSGEHAVLALQGPASGAILARLIGRESVMALEYFHFIEQASMVVARLGYSGELGYELLVPAAEAPRLRERLLEAGSADGLVEASFEAANSLRIEAGYVLFDREIDGRANPRELGLERFVSDPRRRFPLSRKLVGLEITARPARADLPLVQVTSECFSPTLGRRIGLGFAPPLTMPGDAVRLTDGRSARVAPLPFYDPTRQLPRAAPL
ncbi:MAG: aminomethyltransferase family protein [Pseudomonadota bacterium]